MNDNKRELIRLCAQTEKLKKAQISRAEELLNVVDDLNFQEESGNTPLSAAAFKDHRTLVKLFLKHGAEINRVDNANVTPLYRAVLKGYSKMVLLLLKHGADIEITNQNRVTPLLAAVKCRRAEIVRVLIQHGANLFATDNVGETPFSVTYNRHTSDEVYSVMVDELKKMNSNQIFDLDDLDCLEKIQKAIDSSSKNDELVMVLKEKFPQEELS